MKKALFYWCLLISFVTVAQRLQAEVQLGCKALMRLVADQISLAQTEGKDQANHISGYTEGLYETMHSLGSVIAALPSSVPQETITYLNQLKDDLWTYTQNIGTYSSEIQDTLAQIDEQLVLLNDADCDCSSSEIDPDDPSSDCGCCCSDELHEIRDKVIELDNACDEFFIKAVDAFEKAKFFYGVATDFFNKVEHRLWIPDDGLYQDLKNLSNTFKADYLNLLSSSTIDSLFTHTLFTDVGYPFTNEGIVGLFGLATQMNDVLLQIDQANTLHFIASNLVNKTSTDLTFFSNYVAKVQRIFYDEFNLTVFKANQTNPFRSPYFKCITNFWNGEKTLLSYQQYAYNGEGAVTNWFTRIEFALYGLAGFFNNSKVSDDYHKTESEQNDELEKATNKVDFVALGGITNSYSSVRTSLSGLANSLKFSPSQQSQLTLIPEFTFNGQTRGPINLDLSEHQSIFDMIHTGFGIFWRIVFVSFILWVVVFDVKLLRVVSVLFYKGLRLLFS